MAKNSPDKAAPHGAGRDPIAGETAPEAIDRRAQEAAPLLHGSESSAEEGEPALADFRPRDLPDAINEDADSMQSMSRDPSDPIANRGRQVPEYGVDDEKTVLEHLALEGVEEAQDEQMVAARNADEGLARIRLEKK